MSINTFADTRTYCTTNSNITQQGVFAFYDALTRNKTFSYRQCSICQKAVGVVSRRAVPRARDRILGRGAASPPPHQLEDLGESCKLPRTFGVLYCSENTWNMVISIITEAEPNRPPDQYFFGHQWGVVLHTVGVKTPRTPPASRTLSLTSCAQHHTTGRNATPVKGHSRSFDKLYTAS